MASKLPPPAKPAPKQQLALQTLREGIPQGFCAESELRYGDSNGMQYGTACMEGYNIEVLPVPL